MMTHRWWWGVVLGAVLVALLTAAGPWRVHANGPAGALAVTGWAMWVAAVAVVVWVWLRERGLIWPGSSLLGSLFPGVAVRDLTVFTVATSPTRPVSPPPTTPALPGRPPRRPSPPVLTREPSMGAGEMVAFVPQRPSPGLVTYPGRHPALTGPYPTSAAAVGEDGFLPEALAAALRNPHTAHTNAPSTGGGCRIAAGISGAGVVSVDVLTGPGWAVNGPGRDGVIRAVLAQLLQGLPRGNGPVQPVVSVAYARRLGLADPERLGLAVAPTCAVMVRHLAAEITHRSRLAQRVAPSAGLADLRATFPDEPFPVIVAVLDEMAPNSGPMIRSLLARGAPLGVNGLLVGDAFPGVTVAADGNVTADQTSYGLRRAFTLGAEPTRRLLARRMSGTAGEEVTIPLVGWQLPAPPALPASRLAPAQAALPPPAVAPLAAIAVDPPPSPSGASGQGVMLVTFGRPHLTGTDGQPAYHGLLSMEIATYLALHPDGASTATLVDRLLPDADPARGRNQIHRVCCVTGWQGMADPAEQLIRSRRRAR